MNNLKTIQNYSKGAIIYKCKGPFMIGSKIVILENEEVVISYKKKIQYILHPGSYNFTASVFPEIVSSHEQGTLVNSCEIFFINRSSTLAVDWGTDRPIKVQDRDTKIYVDSVAHGEFVVAVKNSEKLIAKIIGVLDVVDEESLKDYLFCELINEIKTFLSIAMTQNREGILLAYNQKDILEKNVECSMYGVLIQYGLFLKKFTIYNFQIIQNKQFELLQHTLKSNEQMFKLEQCYQGIESPTLLYIENISNCDQIQIGTVNSQQTKGLSIYEIQQMVEIIINSLSEIQVGNEKKDEILFEVKKINDELIKKNPKDSIILNAFSTIRNILEGITGSLIASGLINKLGLFV